MVSVQTTQLTVNRVLWSLSGKESARLCRRHGMWSWVASACSGWDSQPVTEAGLRRWSTKSQSLDQWSVTRALALRLCRKEFPQRWKVVKQVKCLLRGKIVQYMWIDTRAVSGRESRWVAPSWQLESLLWGISSWFPLANRLDFSGSLSIFGISQVPPMCTHASLSQDGFYRKGVWVAHPLAWLPFGLQGAFLCICGRGGLVTSGMRNTWSRRGPASSLNCPAIFFLEFWSTGTESPIALPWWRGAYQPPASGQSLGGEHPLEKEMATCSSILAGKSHGQRSLVGYIQFMGSQKSRTWLSH